MKRKIVITTGSRAEYGILRPVIKEISKSPKLKLYLIVTGMHLSKKHGLTINEIKNDGFKIYKKIEMIPKGNTNYFMAQALGKGILDFSKVFQKLKPDINLVLGDRDEVLASALAASHMNIPTAHIHGGDRSQAGIDEYNRHAITKLSNIHFAATQKSKNRIIKMGENPEFVFWTGSPSIDEIIQNNISKKSKLEKKYKIKFSGEDILLLQHPVTTQPGTSGQNIIKILEAIRKLKKFTIAIAPNSDAGNQEIFKNLQIYSKKYKYIKLFKNIPRSDYLGFLKNCKILIGNSSSGIIEAGYFNTIVINIGIRQKDRERGKNIIDIEVPSKTNISSSLKRALNIKKFSKTNIYGRGDSSKKIVKILEKINLDKGLIQKQIYY